jgi:hypothetical protein
MIMSLLDINLTTNYVKDFLKHPDLYVKVASCQNNIRNGYKSISTCFNINEKTRITLLFFLLFVINKCSTKVLLLEVFK